MAEYDEDYLAFTINWLDHQKRVTKNLLDLVNFATYLYYGICLVGAIGFEFPQTNSFFFALPRLIVKGTLGDGVDRLIISCVALNAMVAQKREIRWRTRLLVHAVLGTVLLGTSFNTFRAVFLLVFVLGKLASIKFTANLEVFDLSVSRLLFLGSKIE